MKFQVGDKVLVLHSDEEGEVIDIINNKMVMVEVRGVKFPAYNDDLDFPYYRRFTDKKSNKPRPKQFASVDDVPKEKLKSVDKTDPGVWLTFIPVASTDEFGDEIVETLRIYLLNQTDLAYNFSYYLRYADGSGFDLTNRVSPLQNFYIHDMPFENVNDSPSFSIEFSLVQPNSVKADFFEAALKPKPRQVFNRIQEMQKKGDASFSYKLMSEYPIRAVEEPPELLPLLKKGYKVYAASSARQHLDPPKYELDLHIDKLTRNPARLTSLEMLTIQLQILEKYLDLAVAHHQTSMIIIHGVGKGKLRDEVHEILRQRNDIKSFVNRYHPSYGYGATEVQFQF